MTDAGGQGGRGEQERLDRLLSYLEHDPANPALLRDVAAAALDAGRPGQAADAFARLKAQGDLTDADSNMWAIAAMRAGEPRKAAETFAGLLAAQPGDLSLRFNLAWARAMAGDSAGASGLIDDALVEALPQAALLDIQLMHGAGEFEQAADRARGHLSRHGDYPPLLAAVSVLALDIEDEELARKCATAAGGHPDALATLGTLTLGDREPEQARALFEQALALDAHSPRAWIGLGLADLLQGDGASAGQNIDRGAEIFGDHLGSWIAAGWAHLIGGDLELAHARFEHAVELDGNFAEAQGSLAVTELMRGNRDAAERRVEIAFRLDRSSFSAAFAKALLSAGEGDEAAARRILELAMKQSVGVDGATLGEMIARMAR